MQRIYIGLQNGARRITDRLYLREYYPTIMYGATLVLTMLSVLFVFSLPSPLRPRTSIGLMTAIGSGGMLLMLIFRGRHQSWLSRDSWEPVHYALLSYVTAVLLSLAFTKTIQDTTPLKLLLSGVALFLMAADLHPTARQKRIGIHCLGVLAVCIATLGWLQTIFPDAMNLIAKEFLRGRSAYGIAIEFNRGRLLHWGALIFIFPFFYASTLMLPWRSRFWTTFYIVYGYIAIFAVMAVSNFRWLFVVFLGVSAGYFLYSYRNKLLSAKKMYYIALSVVLTFFVGVTVAHFVFGYNLLDRFLLKDAHRDITESLGRVTLYNQALTVFEAYPLFGAGFGNYFSVVWPFPHMQYYSGFDQFEPFPVPIAAHNEFFTVLAETGIAGLLSYLFLIYFIGKRLYYLIFQAALDFSDHVFALTLCAAYAAIVLFILFENMYPQNVAFLLFIGITSYTWIAPMRNTS